MGLTGKPFGIDFKDFEYAFTTAQKSLQAVTG